MPVTTIPRRDALAVLKDGEPFGAGVHPGEILREEFMEPLGLSAYALAKAAGVPQTRLGEILAGRRSVTADSAVRLALVFGTTAEFWLSLQADHDLRALLEERGRAILDEVRPVPAGEPHAAASK